MYYLFRLLALSIFLSSMALITIVQAASPVIFTAVLPISNIRSTPATSAIPSIGSPTEVRTIVSTLTQSDLDRSIKLLRDRVGMPNIDLAAANASPDPYLMAEDTGYPNVTGANAGVILEIRRERTVELFDENFRFYDLVRWKNGQAITHKFLGMYFPAYVV